MGASLPDCCGVHGGEGCGSAVCVAGPATGGCRTAEGGRADVRDSGTTRPCHQHVQETQTGAINVLIHVLVIHVHVQV